MDYFNDFQGQRTGYVTSYVTWTLGLTHNLDQSIKIRPEVRYGTSTSGTPYNGGQDHDFILGLVDIIASL